jgi:hypothetical protein
MLALQSLKDGSKREHLLSLPTTKGSSRLLDQAPPPVLVIHGSPSKLKARTFRAAFRFLDAGKPQGAKGRRVPRFYRNPVILAQQWQLRDCNSSVSLPETVIPLLGIPSSSRLKATCMRIRLSSSWRCTRA